VIYFGNPTSTGEVREAMIAGLLGAIVTPAQGNRIPDGVPWIADNGCFGKGYPGDEGFLKWLESRKGDRSLCLFATAPDVVGDALATLIRSGPFLPKIRALGYPAALVAQDGLEDLPIPWEEFDAVFLGGSTEWKLSPAAASIAAEARARGKHVHMGRVNSLKRLRFAELIGCDSADGTFLAFAPTENLGRLRVWIDTLRDVPPLPLDDTA
jgi:hypothetical protein